jgi:peptidoglycan/xylan/chitin deacetylase (PgdA/CDA1 family)
LLALLWAATPGLPDAGVGAGPPGSARPERSRGTNLDDVRSSTSLGPNGISSGLDAGIAADGGSAPVRLRARGEVDHGPRATKRIALTFDACSGAPPGKLDQAVLQELEAAHVPATVFVGGRWAEQDPERVKALLADPLLEIGTHAYRHPHLTRLTDAALRGDLTQAIEAIRRQTGRTPTLLRAPYAEADARVVQAAAKLGLTVIGYDVASGDPDPKFGKKRLTRWVLSQARGGSIVVMHINGNGRHTSEALPGIVEGLRKEGYELVTVSQLLGRK